MPSRALNGIRSIRLNQSQVDGSSYDTAVETCQNHNGRVDAVHDRQEESLYCIASLLACL